MENRPQINLPNSNKVLFELPTGRGKTKAALDYLHSKKCVKPLIVLPKRVLISNWNDEIKKWNYDKEIKPTYIQYASFIKYQKWIYITFDAIVFDESHHLSARCIEVLKKTNNIWESMPIALLSATVKKDQKTEWKLLFEHLFIVQDTMQNVISEGTLPTPTVCYIRCNLTPTQRGEYFSIQNDCMMWKKKAKLQPRYEKLYLVKCKFRNTWLAKQKTDIIKEIIEIYKNKRTLTFCADIKHCEEINPVGNITSVNKTSSDKTLDKFNSGKIDHITACAMLDEGVNLVNCQVGIFAYLTISDRLTTQRFGRLLRHPKPIIYIVYFANTRDEEIKNNIEKKFNNVTIPKYYSQEFIMNYRKKKGLIV